MSCMAGKPWRFEFATGRLRKLVFSWMAVVVLCVCCPGCQALNALFGRHDPFGPNAPCRETAQMTPTELVARVNANVERVRGWKNTSAKISGTGFPLGLGASIAVQGPRNLRIVARTPLNNVVDLGSNDQHFWIWMADKKHPEVITCNHEDVAYAARIMPIPFEPDWLMEALGVIPLNENEITRVDERAEQQLVEIYSSRISPSGQPVTKRVTINRCNGLVTEHALLDSAGNMIARATLGQFVRDKENQGILPTLIKLEWPQAEMNLTIKLRDIQFNPSSIPIIQWTPPQNMPTIQIGPGMSPNNAAGNITPIGGFTEEDQFEQPIRAETEEQ